jgi:Nucleoid-associated protein
MSLDIDQIALHQLVKRDENQLELVLRDTLLPATQAVEEMAEELHRVYSAKSKAYGLFNEDSELRKRCATAAKGRMTSWRSAVRLPDACATS